MSAQDEKEKLLEIQQRLKEAERAKFKAEVNFEKARDDLAFAEDSLKEDFGVVSLEDAKVLLEELRKEIQVKTAELEKTLTDIGF